MREAMVYCFNAKLEYLDEYKSEKGDCFIVPFNVLAKDWYEAKQLLEEWLSKPEQTGYKFKQCVGLIPQPSVTVIVKE